MNNTDKIEYYFKGQFLKKAGIVFFNHSTLLKVIIFCSKENIKIIAIDAFFLTENSTQPSQEHDLNFSKFGGKYGNEIINLVKNQPKDMFYEIIVCD